MKKFFIMLVLLLVAASAVSAQQVTPDLPTPTPESENPVPNYSDFANVMPDQKELDGKGGILLIYQDVSEEKINEFRKYLERFGFVVIGEDGSDGTVDLTLDNGMFMIEIAYNTQDEMLQTIYPEAFFWLFDNIADEEYQQYWMAYQLLKETWKEIPCTACSGTGLCHACNGSGKVGNEVCTECGGAGKCGACGGIGYNHVFDEEFLRSYYPESNDNEHNVAELIGKIAEELELVRKGVVCSACDGTGECHSCHGSGKVGNDVCTECGGTGKCGVCDGIGYEPIIIDKDSVIF